MRIEIKRLIIMVILYMLSSSIYSADIKYHKSIRTVGTTPVVLLTSDTVMISGLSGNSFDIKKISDIITFGIDHNNPTFISDTSTIGVQIQVDRWDISNNHSDTILTLTIQNNPLRGTSTEIDKQIYSFCRYQKYIVTIKGITINNVAKSTLPSYLYISTDIEVTGYYYFGTNALNLITTSNSLIDNDCDGLNDEIQISWTTEIGAENYQLEWTFINDYNDLVAPHDTLISPDSLNYNFRHNSTRITTANTYYKITMAFEHGWLLYRVRGIGCDTADPTKVIYGVWNVVESGEVSSVATSSKYHVIQEHEMQKNWQYSASYAEEGKKKEVISYFDGSLRNRESVTKINSDSTVIVGQTIYDSQGRPAVNILPVPVSKTLLSCSPTSSGLASVKYYDRFNRDSRDSVYSRYNFDSDTGNCLSVAAGMDSLHGAANYYSPESPDKYAQQAYLPNSHKYPFTQIQYTPDNTGRISRQSGVGPDFKIGSGHETNYYYGQPNQIQLDRMFGSEVGDATHYKKNLVFDANGQASVSYLDQEGRVIATSLAGDNTVNLDPISSITGAQKTLTVDLFAKDANGVSNMNTVAIGNDSIVFNTQILVESNTNYSFNYTLLVDTMKIACSKICYDCIYNLAIKVTGECGDTVADIGGSRLYSRRHKVGHFTQQNGNIVFSNDCSLAIYSDPEAFVLPLVPGNYTVSKILSIDNATRDYYIKEYLDSTNGCLHTLNYFIQGALAKVDTTDCNIGCKTCMTSLGDRDEWVASGKGTALQYDQLYEECGKPCRNITLCEATYSQLLSDVSPGGQYAQYIDPGDTLHVKVNVGLFPLSVLNTSNELPKNVTSSIANWKHPLVKLNGYDHNCYIEDNGDTSKINVAYISGSYFPPVDNNAIYIIAVDIYMFTLNI